MSRTYDNPAKWNGFCQESHIVVGLDIQEQRRKHADGFLSRNVTLGIIVE